VLYWAATLAGLLVFLLVYFRSYWVRGVRLLPMIAIETALAVGFAPFNTGSAVFFVYAAATAGQLDRQGDAIRMIAGLALLGGLTGFFVDAPSYFFITAVPVTLVIGGVNLHFAQTARAQHKLRLAQEEIEQLAAVAERERIARDLHDVLGHTLSLIVLKAELAARLAERDPGRAAGEMRDVETVARRTLQDVREAIRGYHPTLADEAARARSMLKAAGIAHSLELETAALPLVIEETLALALREAVTNVVRHSGASLCRAAVERSDREISLSIADDGRGSHAPEGSGLRGMRERVEAFGGEVTRAEGRGLSLRISLPLPDAGADSPAAPPARGLAG
jgi:two-component system sensor histidine kinase DesK